METQKLVLEISSTLFEQLEQLSALKEESIESLAIRMIARQVPTLTQEAQELANLLANVTPEMLQGEIEMGESVGREIFW